MVPIISFVCGKCQSVLRASEDPEILEAIKKHLKTCKGSELPDPLVLSAESEEEDQEDARIRNDRYGSF